MKLFYKLFLILIIINYPYSASCQDIAFSQFYDQPLLRNPALAGIFTGDVRIVAAYRNQWQSFVTPYRTFGLSSEIKFPIKARPGDNITLGLQLIKDVAGTSDFSTTQILPAFNYSYSMNDEKNSYISLGFMGGLIQQRFDPTKLILNDQFIPGSNGSFSISSASSQVFTNSNVSNYDFSTGISYSSVFNNNVDYFIGAGLFHLTKSKSFFNNDSAILNKKFTINFGLSAPTGDDDQFILYGDYFKQGNINTFQFGAMYSHDLLVVGDDHTGITAGMLYRWDDAIIPIIQLELHKFIIGTSYDINISNLVVASQYRGGFELTLTYKDFLNSRRADLQSTRCPKFGGHMPTGHFLGY